MADPIVLRRNERIKAYAGQLFNLGAALLAASIVRIAAGVFDGSLVLWITGTIVLISAGAHLLGYPEDEE